MRAIPVPVMDRILRATRWVERRMQNSPGQRARWHGHGSREHLVWFQLIGHLHTNSSTTAYRMTWSSGSEVYTPAESNTTVYDTTGSCWGIPNEWVLCRQRAGASGLWEVVVGGAGWHRATLTEDLEQGSSASATIDGSAGSGSAGSVTVTVYDGFLSTDDSITAASAGAAIGISYDKWAGRWYVTEATC